MIDKVCGKIDDFKHPRKIILGFLLIWLIVNIIQALFTELAHDEAYYWLFSRKLDWGYFDHPPMIALLVKIGYSVFQNEFGVRLLPLLMGTVTMYLIYLMAEKHLSSISTFILLASSVIVFQTHIGGFLAIPDLPVVFFATLFFFLFQKYLSQDSIKTAVLLGVTGAAMLYSKYHGILVLIFTLLAYLPILKRKTFWLIPVLITILMLPHLFWQIENGFPTFEYHLVSRSSAYKIGHTLNYILGQVLLAGPFIGVILFFHAVVSKVNKNPFFRVMKLNFYGFFVFFLLMSFKGHVEAHWTAIGFIPLIILSATQIEKKKTALKWVRKLYLPVIIAFFILRLGLIFEIVPAKYKLSVEFHNWDKWAQQIKDEAQGRKVVFLSTFQRPAKYSFYSGGEFAHSFNHVYYRQNQFDLWGYNDSIQGQDIILFRTGRSADSIYTATSENYGYRLFDNFESYIDLPILIKNKKLVSDSSENIKLQIIVLNTKQKSLNLSYVDKSSPRFCLTLYNGKKFLPLNYLHYIDTTIESGDSLSTIISFVAPKESGNYTCQLSIVNNNLPPGFNSKPFKLKVKSK